nr:hypothetical protein [Tanacetum cinerariifolium]
MSTPKFTDVHNLVVFLSKPTESKGFEQIINFLNANPIKYALTMNPTIYTLCIEQFWATATAKNINGEAQIHAKVDGKKAYTYYCQLKVNAARHTLTTVVDVNAVEGILHKYNDYFN